MLHLFTRCFNYYFVSQRSTKGEATQTVLLLALSGVVLYFIYRQDWMLLAGLVVGILGLISDTLAFYIDFLWRRLGWLLGLVVPKVILSIVFFLFLTPLAILSKIFGPKDPLHLTYRGDSLFKVVDKKFNKSHFEKMW